MNAIKYIWGKTKKLPSNEQNILVYHPLICHLIDTAAVVGVLWDQILSKSIKRLLMNLFSMNQVSTKNTIMWIAGLHDLGKATPIFQAKIPEVSSNLEQYGLHCFFVPKIYHSILSGELFTQIFEDEQFENPLINKIKYVIGGHHGRYPKIRQFRELIPEYLGGPNWRAIQLEIFRLVLNFCGFQDVKELTMKPSTLSREKQGALLVYLSGLISIADWIASNENLFDFFNEFETDSDLTKKYFTLSIQRAKKALKKIGWVQWQSVQNQSDLLFSFEKIFEFSDLRPLQTTIVEMKNEIISPSLIIIEAPMGEGKTEVAFYIQYYLERYFNQNGAYVALPTQATANQMFERIQKFLSKTKHGSHTNLHLLHGKAVLSDKYQELITNSQNFEEESNIVADEWFTYRKRGLISPFGVGTIDQILLSVLPLKHFFIRLFGLAGKTIIIDEVHSYDIYMSTILETLLKWLKLLGSNVILLSATLPSYKQKALLKTFYDGNEDWEVKPYPRITFCSPAKIITETFDVQIKKQKENSVLIDWVEKSALADTIKDILTEGGRLAIICNTIKNAQDLYEDLEIFKENKIEIILLHSRFPYHRRQEIENDVLKKFGREYGDHTQQTRILISTQIIEQSLDLDFDLMISELCPIDLIFQRMGRLHRHLRDQEGREIIRPPKLNRPLFWIFKPELTSSGIPKISYSVYSKYILLKTYLYMKDIKTISIPDDLQRTIELVYDEKNEILDNKQKEYEVWKNILTSEQAKQKSKDRDKFISAEYRIIPDPADEDFFQDFSVYLEENSKEAQESLHSLTRITNPTVTLLGLFQEKDKVYVDQEKTIEIDIKEVPDRNVAKTILDYSVNISNYDIVNYFSERGHIIPFAWKKNRLTYHIYPVNLEKDDSNQYFVQTDKYNIIFDRQLGLYLEKKKKGTY
ncbi:MAG: CRISPR-associated helicase Cas3' [Candidatus Odinarchaeota archaeon]